MAKILDRINIPEDLKKLSVSELPELASEIRSLIVETVAGHGGHLSSSLGAVELITALHWVFETPRDRLVFDVGHQGYAHKMLTGRRAGFERIGQEEGIGSFDAQALGLVVGHRSGYGRRARWSAASSASPTGAGAPSYSARAVVVLGKAITSRREPAPASSITTRSNPTAKPP